MDSDLNSLEFGGICRLLERLSFSPYGADAARSLEPAPSIGVAREMQSAVTAARGAIDAYAVPKLAALPDVRAALRQAEQQGAALSPNALANLRQVMQTGLVLREFVALYPALYRNISALKAPVALWEALDATISSAGRLREDATPDLRALHQQYHAAQQQVEAQVKARMHSPDVAGVFEENSRVHWHGTRGVLAVRSNFADRIKGVRRGTVGGGRDVLIEPMEAVGLNNRLEALGGQIEAQNQVVLRAVTDTVRSCGDDLAKLLDAITWIDLALAAGQMSAAMNAAPPELVDKPMVELKQAYHPQLLLQFMEKNIQRIRALDILLDENQPMLVITGPNTGGKTVVLKTVGLLVTMAYCGLHIPSEGKCIIGDFNRIIVDVGDKQSLYHHLSTFAGHVEVLKRLLAEADDKTLVLMDELGTGTDPEEGAALAMAVLDELAMRKVHGIVTTHLSPLKRFASQHAYLCNASMRFDYDSLSPTYELEVGVAGQSLGLVIAEKKGLPSDLVAKARGYLKHTGGE